MHDKLRQQTSVLIDTTLGGVEEGDSVAIIAPHESRPLVRALYMELAERETMPVGIWGNSLYGIGDMELAGDFMRHYAGDEMPVPQHLLEVFNKSDHIVMVSAFKNADEHSDIPYDKVRMLNDALGHTVESILNETNAALTIYPNSAGAQLAGMSTDAFKSYVWDSILEIDWEKQAAYQDKMVDIINNGSTVEITAEDTDLTMSIDGMQAVNEAGREINMPSGEVYTAPVIDSVNGEVTFDTSVISSLGGVIRKPRFEFESGELVSFSAAHGEDILASIIETDDGAKRVGELGIGMNQQMDRTTGRIELDEKIGETIHIALGSAYDECVGAERERNESRVHKDFILGTDNDIVMNVDGEEVLNQNGFIFDR